MDNENRRGVKRIYRNYAREHFSDQWPNHKTAPLVEDENLSDPSIRLGKAITIKRHTTVSRLEYILNKVIKNFKANNIDSLIKLINKINTPNKFQTTGCYQLLQ